MNSDIVNENDGNEVVVSKVKWYIPVVEAMVVMAVLQALRGLFMLIVSPAFLSTSFAKKMLTMAAMVLLTPLVLIYSKKKNVELKLMPDEFSKGYKIFTGIAAALLIANPVNFTVGITAFLENIYGSVVTPIFEETIFRGYIWRRFESLGMSRRSVFWWNTVLFSLWHLGYLMTNLFVGDMLKVFGKLAVGFCYGIILCIVRRKNGNIYSCMLVHGILNILMP